MVLIMDWRAHDWLTPRTEWHLELVQHGSLTFHDDEDGGGGGSGGDSHGHISSNVIILIFEDDHESGDFVKYLA